MRKQVLVQLCLASWQDHGGVHDAGPLPHCAPKGHVQVRLATMQLGSVVVVVVVVVTDVVVAGATGAHSSFGVA